MVSNSQTFHNIYDYMHVKKRPLHKKIINKKNRQVFHYKTRARPKNAFAKAAKAYKFSNAFSKLLLHFLIAANIFYQKFSNLFPQFIKYFRFFMARLTIVRGPYRFCPVRACIFCFPRKWYLWVSKRLLV